MQVTQAQIASGAARFIRNDVIPKIPDRGFRVVLDAAAAMAELSPQILDGLFKHPMAAVLLHPGENGYDLDYLETALTSAVETHGGLPVVIPAIPLISREEKTLTFGAEDIRQLMRQIRG